jgi:UDP-N-acetylglucosamine transferase subunit ALG13
MVHMPRPLSIVVTVGTTNIPFPELITWAERHCQEHSVFVQHGSYNPPKRNLTAYANFLPYVEMVEKLKSADIIIAHAGIPDILILPSA